MPLLEPLLITEFSKVLNYTDPLFSGYSNSPSVIANRLSTALFNYGSGVIPASSTSLQAKNSSSLIFQQILAPNSAITLIPQGVKAFCDVLATGMTSSGFTSIPPIGLVSLQPLYDREYPEQYTENENLERCRILAEQIHNHFITGTATNINSGATVNWN